MNITYFANCLQGSFSFPEEFVTRLDPKQLAEIAASDHWREHPEEAPMDITALHLCDVGGLDLGLFEVRHERCSIYTAVSLGPLKETGPVE